MARLTKAEKQVQSMQRRQRREAAQDEIVEARMRTLIGFAGGYVGSALAAQFLPPPNPASPIASLGLGSTVDLAMAGVGGYLAFTDFSELGDYATGAALVGTTQILDRVVAAVQGVLTPAGG